MAYQKVFKSIFINELVKGLSEGKEATLKLYEKDIYPVLEENCLIDARLVVPDETELLIPNGKNLFNFENAKKIFEAFDNLPLIKASDPGFWTYLTHVTFWKYM